MRARGVALVAFAAGLTGCPDDKPAGDASRVQRVQTATAKPGTTRFCDKTFPASGPGAKTWSPPPLRPLDGAPGEQGTAGWRWVTAWATWCSPCVEEMGLFGRWKDGLTQEGVPVRFEFLSVDETEAEPKLRAWLGKKLPGAVTWAKSPEAFQQWLSASVGLEPESAIPLHFLVDPAGNLRCARVGAVHAQDYGTVKAILSGR
jgi:hypothetical protein